jgi:plasmid stabilization system protein ParE
LIKFTSRAGRQLADLKAHYVKNLRLNALESLDKALVTAAAAIELAPAKGLPAPRPYPQLARPGILWRHQGRYWIAWRRVPNLAITAVFYDAADIPGRL